MSILGQIGIIFVLFICAFTFVNRVCNCIEHCSTNRAIVKTVKASKPDKDDAEKIYDTLVEDDHAASEDK